MDFLLTMVLMCTFILDQFSIFYPYYFNLTFRQDSVDLEKLASREKKWLDMIKNWDYWMSHNFPKVKERCRKGIPPSLRGKVWLKLTGAEKKIAESPNGYSV